jgi:transposase
MMKSLPPAINRFRRRDWTPAQKAQYLDEALQPGVTIASVADKHGISRGLFYQWMKKARAGLLPGVTLNAEPATRFVPVKLSKENGLPKEQSSAPQTAATAKSNGALIEVVLLNGRVLKVREGIDAAVLGKIADALDRPGP